MNGCHSEGDWQKLVGWFLIVFRFRNYFQCLWIDSRETRYLIFLHDNMYFCKQTNTFWRHTTTLRADRRVRLLTNCWQLHAKNFFSENKTFDDLVNRWWSEVALWIVETACELVVITCIRLYTHDITTTLRAVQEQFWWNIFWNFLGFHELCSLHIDWINIFVSLGQMIFYLCVLDSCCKSGTRMTSMNT